MKDLEENELFDKEYFVMEGFNCYTGWTDEMPFTHFKPYPCGYIGIPKGHKLYGVNYNDIDEYGSELMCSGKFNPDYNGGIFNSTAKVDAGKDDWFIGFDIGSANSPGTKQHVIEKITEIVDVLKGLRYWHGYT